eukprot:618549-Rhodomonas_salina.1
MPVKALTDKDVTCAEPQPPMTCPVLTAAVSCYKFSTTGGYEMSATDRDNVLCPTTSPAMSFEKFGTDAVPSVPGGPDRADAAHGPVPCPINAQRGVKRT